MDFYLLNPPCLKLDLFSCKLISILCVRSRFIELGKAEKSEEDQCCPMGLKTGEPAFCISLIAFLCLAVQILGGILAILSGVMLVIFFAKLDDVISRQYQKIFEVSCHNQIIIIGGW